MTGLSADSLLKEAQRSEERFRWPTAASKYRGLIAHTRPTETDRHGELLERLGNAYYHIAMQSDSFKRFHAKMGQAIESYRKARSVYDCSPRMRGQSLRCQATEHYIDHWLAKGTSQKKAQLDEAWRLAQQALHFFRRSESNSEFGRTFNQLSIVVSLATPYEWDHRIRTIDEREIIETGREAIERLYGLRDRTELARALAKTAIFLDAYSEEAFDNTQLKDRDTESIRYWKRALVIARDTAILEVGKPPSGFWRVMQPPEVMETLGEALTLARQTGDNLAIGWISAQLAGRKFWEVMRTEENTTKKQIAGEALTLAEESAARFDRLRFTVGMAEVLWVHSPYVEHFMQLSWYEIDPEIRRRLMEKSYRATPDLLNLARRSNYPKVIAYSHHVTSRSAVDLAEAISTIRRKKALLADAMRHRKEAIKIREESAPNDSWNFATDLRWLSDIQVGLAGIGRDRRIRSVLLEQALRTKEKALVIAAKFVASMRGSDTHILRGAIARYHTQSGNTLSELYKLTRKEEYLRKAAKEFTEAANNARLQASKATSYWRAAQAYDVLQAHALASESFSQSAKTFETLGQKSVHLRELHLDNSRYLEAWSKIELAREHHKQFRHNVASRLYRKAARLHESTRKWSFLGPYFLAWSKLEQAEALDRKGYESQTIRALADAAGQFERAKATIEAQLPFIDENDERNMAANVAKAAMTDYCRARIVLEEAKIAEKLGDYKTASEKFDISSEKLEKVSLPEPESEWKDPKFLSLLARAWSLSCLAEYEHSEQLLKEASVLFRKAEQTSPTRESGTLAAGHARFCNAMIERRKFFTTMKPEFYRSSVKQLDLAARTFLNSGFTSASTRATAEKLLLDAIVETSRANDTQEPSEKTKRLESAQLLLKESAAAFARARQPRKKEDIERLAEKIRMELEASSRLAEIFNTMPSSSTIVAFPTPSQGGEIAVGLASLEHANIEARLIETGEESKVKDFARLRIEITNTGKQPVRILRLEGLGRDHSRIIEASDGWRVDGNSLHAQAFKIGPVQTNSIECTVGLKPDGVNILRPRVIFTDDQGKQWQRVLQPKVLVPSPILQFLAKEFALDYASRGLAVNHCGWRTLMEIAKSLKMPRSQVYGDLRYGHMFGKPLETLLESTQLESRVFPGERGRGGSVTKARVAYDNPDMRTYVNSLTNGLEKRLTR